MIVSPRTFEIARGHIPLVQPDGDSSDTHGFIKVGLNEAISGVRKDWEDFGEYAQAHSVGWKWVDIEVESSRIDREFHVSSSDVFWEEFRKKQAGSKHAKGEFPMHFVGNVILGNSVVIESVMGTLYRSGFRRGDLLVFEKKKQKILESFLQS